MSREADAMDEIAKKAFYKQMVMTLSEVAELIHATVYTARRRLKEWGVLTSYNQNGRYYVLPDIPKFDANGLWQRNGVYFSRYGNLKQTVVELVHRAPTGLDAREIGALLSLNPRSFLSPLANHSQLKREKISGRFVYFSSDTSTYEAQQKRRLLFNITERQPTAFEAIAILVEKIKHPAISDEALSRRLKKQKISVDPEIIQNLFIRHGLTVKKTPHSI